MPTISNWAFEPGKEEQDKQALAPYIIAIADGEKALSPEEIQLRTASLYDFLHSFCQRYYYDDGSELRLEGKTLCYAQFGESSFDHDGSSHPCMLLYFSPITREEYEASAIGGETERPAHDYSGISLDAKWYDKEHCQDHFFSYYGGTLRFCAKGFLNCFDFVRIYSVTYF